MDPMDLTAGTEPGSPVSTWYESQRLKPHCLGRGHPERPPLPLNYGYRDHACTWSRVAAWLAGHHCAYASDLRGHRDSEWAIASQYRLPEHVLDRAQSLVRIPGQPVGLIRPRDGRFTLDNARRRLRQPPLAAKYIRHYSAQVVPNAGHWVHHDHLDGFAEAVSGFLH